jgi:BASS family bile acid:Na+ symporter
MPVSGPIPEAVLTLFAAATLFIVMFDIGLGIVPGEFHWVWAHWLLLLRALFAVVIIMPVLALLVVHLLSLPYPVEIGIMLMAIAPGAPIALRRSLDAGGHHAFAPALQIGLALLAVGTMPLWIAALDTWYAGHAAIAPDTVARQVFMAQLLPLCAGMLARATMPTLAARLLTRLPRIATLLLLVFIGAVVIEMFAAADVEPRNAFAMLVVTIGALALGHALGGPYPATRSATAISTAMRNGGLAVLVASANRAAPEIFAALLGYLLVSALVVLIYVAWRRRAALHSVTT